MELRHRLAVIIKENKLKQAEFAHLIGITPSYVSALLSGRNKKLSATLANLTEEKLGYRAEWVLSGAEPKFKQIQINDNAYNVKEKALNRLEVMSMEKAGAVWAFICFIDKIDSALSGHAGGVR